MEPERVGKDGRVFNVLINARKVLERLDVAEEAGSSRKALVKEVKDIGPCTTIEVSLRRGSGKPPLLCGIEVIAE